MQLSGLRTCAPSSAFTAHSSTAGSSCSSRASSGRREPTTTLRRLLLETDAAGERRSYHGDGRGMYRIVRDLQVRDMIVPVVGDLAGLARACGNRAGDRAQRPEGVRALYLERRVLSVRRRPLSPLHQQPGPPQAHRSLRDHPIDLQSVRTINRAARLSERLHRSNKPRARRGVRGGRYRRYDELIGRP